MSWLLKVVDGPVKGAEVALIEGTRVKVGSSSACDIVLPDASLAEEAFELDVSEGTVTLITPDGTQSQLTPFEIRDFGTTAVAIGPADEPWGELVRPAPVAEAAKPEPEPEPEKPAEEEKKPRSSVFGIAVSRVLLAVAAVVVVVLLLGALALMRGCSRTDSHRDETVETRILSLEEIAAQHGLKLEKDGDVRILKGNLRRRTERLAIRALALASDPRCKLDLTDDQTLLQACNDVLTLYSEGKVKAVSASNRVVRVAGHVSDSDQLERLLRAIDEDVRGVERVDVRGVSVNDMFAVPTPIEERPVEQRIVEVRVPGTSETNVVTNVVYVSAAAAERPAQATSAAPVATPVATPSAAPVATPVPVPASPRSATPGRLPTITKVAGKRAGLPFEGILTKPYPCVVLRDGLRILEGARVGAVKVVSIEADRLVLDDNGRLYEWRP